VALAAVARNSAIVLPYLNRPHHISGSWKVLDEMRVRVRVRVGLG
jgi:hypothetical protein